MGLREDRLAQNEALARRVNERVEELSDELRGPVPRARDALEILCECGRDDCVAKITVPFDAYERVRESPVRFIVAPEHEVRDVEYVVERSTGYVVVEKKEHESHIARATNLRADPRADPRS